MRIPLHVCEEHVGICPACGDSVCMWCLLEVVQEEVRTCKK
jgi:hypothetical protein